MSISEFESSSDVPNQASPLDLLAAVPPGLMLVVVKSRSQLPLVRATLTHQLLHASDKKIGLKFPPIKQLFSLYAGSDRQQQYAQANHAAFGPPPPGVEHQFKSFGTRSNYDWCSTEGLPPLLSLINSSDVVETPCWYTVAQIISDSSKVMQVDALAQIRHAAKAAGVYVLVFLVCDEKVDETHFNDLCDEYLEIEECEPDMGFNQAFSIDCYGLRDLNALGLGKTMCNLHFEGMRVTQTYAPFIASDFKTRAMWILRGMGLSFAEIGVKVGMHKSNVLRNLLSLPKPCPIKVADDWLECLDEYLAAGLEKAVKTSPDDDDDGEDEFEEDN